MQILQLVFRATLWEYPTFMAKGALFLLRQIRILHNNINPHMGQGVRTEGHGPVPVEAILLQLVKAHIRDALRTIMALTTIPPGMSPLLVLVIIRANRIMILLLMQVELILLMDTRPRIQLRLLRPLSTTRLVVLLIPPTLPTQLPRESTLLVLTAL
jgi:hypothetical protein